MKKFLSIFVAGCLVMALGAGVFAPIPTAKAGAPNYTVTFDSQGGSLVNPEVVLAGATLVAGPSDPLYAGYTFGGWFIEAACTNPYDFYDTAVMADFTLYAKWTAEVLMRVGTAVSAVNLGTAGNYVIFAEAHDAGITSTGNTLITGDIGTTAPATTLTNFGLTLDSSGAFSKTGLIPETTVVGKVYAFDYAGGDTSVNMTTAAGELLTAYTYAKGQATTSAAFLNIGTGTVSAQTLVPGVYTWGSNVKITGDIILDGAGVANPVWIFQISGTLNVMDGVHMSLAGGANAANIFWAVSGATTLLPGATFEGNILAATNIATAGGNTVDGRLLAQTAVTLISTTVGLAGYIAPPAPTGTITIFEVTDPNGAQDFSFTTTGGLLPATFSLDEDTDPTLSNTQGFSGLAAGTYTITEAPAEGYTLVSIVGATSADLGSRTATITLAAGEAGTVTFTNNSTPTPPVTYTVTFDSQSGTPTPAPITGIVANATITLPGAPTLAGSTFNGWFTATTGGTVFDGTTPVIANITVYAQWTATTPVTYTVTFDKNGGDTEASPTTSTGILNNGTATLPTTNPTLAGSTFAGWFTAITGGSAFDVTTPVITDITVYAQWTVTTPATYTVTFDSQSGTPTPAPITGIAAGATVTLPGAPTLAGSTFNGWFTAITGGTAFDVTTPVITDITVYAQWTATTPVTPPVVTPPVVTPPVVIPPVVIPPVVIPPVVTKVYHQTFFIGYPDGMFKPNRKVSRAEVAAALTRALGLGWSTIAPSYPDVPATHWAAEDIQIMKTEGIMIGDTSGKFRPDAPITRAEAATALLRLLKITPIQNLPFSNFPDVPVTYWAAGYIAVMQMQGYIIGYPDGTYKPTVNILRSEFTAIADRTLGREISNASQVTGLVGGKLWTDVPTTYWAYLYILEASTPHTVTNAVRLNRNIVLSAKTIPLYSDGAASVTIRKVGDVLNAIVPVDGLLKGVAPAARQVTVVITVKLKP